MGRKFLKRIIIEQILRLKKIGPYKTKKLLYIKEHHHLNEEGASRMEGLICSVYKELKN